jgi:putative NIF3 family GTP cyclohydrolase 1 type 2
MVDPIIFQGLKSLRLGDPQQRNLMKLCAKGIGVYCPHTSVDAGVGGVNDWLASLITLGREVVETSPIVPCTPVEGSQYQCKS